MGFEDEKNRFFKKVGVISEYLRTFDQTINKAFFSRLNVLDGRTMIMSGLGYQCATTFEEVRLVCREGFGLAGAKLLRGLYERVVTAAYFIKNPEAATEFVRSFDLDFGKLLHRNQEFFRTNGVDPNQILPDDVLKGVEKSYKEAREKVRENSCKECGAPRGRVDVVSMAQNALPSLVPYLGIAYLQPTLHVHASWYSIVDSLNLIKWEGDHMELDPQPEEDRALKILQLAHLLMLHAFETQNTYFTLNLDEEIAERRKEYDQLWEAVSAIK